MILSDRTIADLLSNDKLIIDNKPEPNQIQPASLDVRLGNELIVPKTGKSIERSGFTLEPGVRYLGHTMEVVDLPNDIAAQLAGRSTIGRKGIIVHKTAGWIDPGFEGQITLELMNMGERMKTISAGDRVAQLVFSKLDQESNGYRGQYQGQRGATEAGR